MATSAASTGASGTVVFKARLDGSQTVPGNLYPGVGWATVSFDTALKTMTTDLLWTNISGPSDSAHVHSGAKGSPADGVFDHEVINDADRTEPCTWKVPDPRCVPPGLEGDGSSTHSVLDVSDGGGFASFDALLAAANAGGLYVDMHTEANPDGEIRGQLVPAQPTLRFTAHLDSAQVYNDGTPEHPGSDSTATGTARVEIDPVLLTMTTDLEWSGLTGPADRAHNHSGVKGQPTDGIFFHEVIDDADRTVIPCGWTVEVPVYEDCVPPTGSTHDVLDVVDGYGYGTYEALVAALQAGELYTDIHTEKFVPGEIRGQLYPDSALSDELQIIFKERKKDEWKAGHKASVKFTIADANGVQISDAQAAGLLSPNCRVTVSATGAQDIAPACATYRDRPSEFAFHCKLKRHPTGDETVTVTVSYPGTDKTTTKSQSVTIVKK